MNLIGLLIGLAILLTIALLDGKMKTFITDGSLFTQKSTWRHIFNHVFVSWRHDNRNLCPLFLQTIHLFSPLTAGYLTAIMAAGWTIGALFSANKTGAIVIRIIRTGPVIIFISLIMLAVLTHNQQLIESWPLFVIYLIAMAGVGLGIGVCWPHLVLRVFKNAPEGEENLASSSIITIQLYATALSAALVGVVVNNSGPINPGDRGAQQASIWLFALFAISPLLATVLIRKIK